MKIIVIHSDSHFIRCVDEAVSHEVSAPDLRWACLPHLRREITEAGLIFLAEYLADEYLDIRVDEIAEGRRLTGIDVFAWVCDILGPDKAQRVVIGIDRHEQRYLARQLCNPWVLARSDANDFLDDVSKFPELFRERQPE